MYTNIHIHICMTYLEEHYLHSLISSVSFLLASSSNSVIILKQHLLFQSFHDFVSLLPAQLLYSNAHQNTHKHKQSTYTIRGVIIKRDHRDTRQHSVTLQHNATYTHQSSSSLFSKRAIQYNIASHGNTLQQNSSLSLSTPANERCCMRKLHSRFLESRNCLRFDKATLGSPYNSEV